MSKRSPSSLRSLAEKFSCSPQTIANLKKEGLDLTDDSAVRARLAENDRERPSESLPLTLPSSNGGTGLRAAIERLQSAELAAHADYLNALANAPEQSGKTLRAWNAILDQLRKIESDNPTIEKENAQTITKEELAKELGELFRNLRQDLDSLPRRISLLAGKSKRELEAGAEDETSRIIDSLFACKYLEK